MKIVVACGGTGGHSFPGIAVAKELKARGHEVVVWTSGREIESSVMKSWEGPGFSTGAKQIKPKYALSILASYWRCCRELAREKPDVLLAMGSYSSLPPVLAARRKGVPVVLHEANTVPGKAVEFLARFARAVATSFEMTAHYLPHAHTVLTGLPVRREITEGARFDFIPAGSFTLFITGGSQGAHRVNELACEAVRIVKKELDSRTTPGRPFYVVHQTGVADEGQVLAVYTAINQPARVHAFERQMADAFKSADLVIARAGASTCFELAACGKAVFFIPLPSAMRNHQHYNADAFVSLGAADEGDQQALTPRNLAKYILRKYDHPEELVRLSENIGKLATPEAAAKVADLVLSYAR